MRVKKFEAKSMKEALNMVKNELGPDAVILSARDNRKSFGLAGGPSVEITAAVSEQTLSKKKFAVSRLNTHDRERFQQSDARTQRQFIDKMVDSRLKENEAAIRRPITSVSYIDIPDDEVTSSSRRAQALERAAGRNVSELLEGFESGVDEVEEWTTRTARTTPKAAKPQPARARPAAAAAATRNAVRASAPVPPGDGMEAAGVSDGVSGGVSGRAIARIRSATREALKNNPFLAEEKTTAVNPAVPLAAQPPKADPEIIALKGEIGRLQELLKGFQQVPQTFVGMHPGADYGIQYDLSFMFQKLTEAGVNIDNSVEILQEAAKSMDPVQMKKRPIVDAWVARYFLDHIQVVSNPFHGRMHLFVGGSGSGKTSTLVKMASHLVVKEKKKVAVLSTDSFKVGAVDQLKIYCQILNVPFAVIRSRKDWEWVLGQLNHVDHILVDFPGLQLRDLDEIHLLKSLLPPTQEGQVNSSISHLCVAATAKDGDGYEIARRYKVADYSDLIITNLDQSVQHGMIYNLHRKTGKPLHSFGIGNRIPEDFEPASKERVLDLIFKLTRLRRENK